MLATSSGYRDDTSRVFWLQTDQKFVDCRVPKAVTDRQDLRCKTLEHCNPAELADLAGQQGFAGNAVVTGDCCYWNRELDFQPAGGPPDIGRMVFRGTEQVIEHGLDDSYHEVWDRLPASCGQTAAFCLAAKHNATHTGLLVISGDFFSLAINRSVFLDASGKQLIDVIKTLNTSQQRSMLAFELSFGQIGGCAKPWIIQCSTLPGREGESLLPVEESVATLARAAEACKPVSMGAYAPSDGWVLTAAE